MELNVNKRPVLLKTCDPNDCGPTEHWVVVTSGKGQDAKNYKMHDPAYEVGDMSLDLYTEKKKYTLLDMVVYSGEPACNSPQAEHIGALFTPLSSLQEILRSQDV